MMKIGHKRNQMQVFMSNAEFVISPFLRTTTKENTNAKKCMLICRSVQMFHKQHLS